MSADQLFYESWDEAAREVIRAAGGTKKVAAMLWPAKTNSSQRLTDCLNPSRDEKLAPDELFMLMRIGREVGCHALARYANAETGYAPPVITTPDDEAAREKRAFVDSVETVRRLAARLEAKGLL